MCCMIKALPPSQWGYAAAAHLLARAGFSGSPAQVQQLADQSLEAAVSSLLDYEKIPDPTPAPEWAAPDPDRRKKLEALRTMTPEARQALARENRQDQQKHLLQLREWWLRRMTYGPRPLQERLTLFWHGHFATSFVKVQDAYLMWRQNETFRRFASGNWLELLVAVSKDPAMLIWLDQAQSRKQHPNENYAREVMELFTLGEGHYTEKDVTEAARALTGWSYDRLSQEFVGRAGTHDTGEKLFLGKSGNLNGMDVLRQIVAQPQAARFITAKLWKFFAGTDPSDAIVTELAAEFQRANLNFKPLLRALFTSEAFYSDEVVGKQVKSPVQWLVGTVRLLGSQLPPPLASTNTLRQLGQDLFAPPNVKGWDGGISWITTNNLLNRYAYAAFLVMGRDAPPKLAQRNGDRPRLQAVAARLDAINQQRAPFDVRGLVPETDRQDVGAVMAALEKYFLLVPLRTKQEVVLREYLAAQPQLDDQVVRNAMRLVICTPEYQLT